MGPRSIGFIERQGGYTPIEGKWTDTPSGHDARHLDVFLLEYPSAREGFVICRVPRTTWLSARIRAIPWQDLPRVLD